MELNSYLLRPRINLSNFATGGVIGTAVATVDIVSSLSVTQTTALQTLSLPSPTITIDGLDLVVYNAGTIKFDMHTLTIDPGKFAIFEWHNGGWRAPVAGSTPADFWRSGVGATALPDGTTDLTENIRRNGAVGINADPLTTMDVSGSFGVGVVTTALPAYTALITDHTIILTGAVAQAVTLPAANLFTRRIVKLVNRSTVGKTFTPVANMLNNLTSGILPAATSMTLQSDGTNWYEIDNAANTLTTAAFSQIVASGTINLGDPIPNGIRPTISFLNVGSATGLDSSAGDARLQVTFVTPVANANYTITGSLRSNNAANWNNDNDTTWHTVSKTTSGFVIAIKELNAVAQDISFDFECSLIQVANAFNTSSNEVAAFVLLNTPVVIDNLQIEARLIGGQGFRLAAVAGTMLVNVSASTTYAADAVFGSNRPGVTLTTTMTHPFGWVGQSDADALIGHIHDRTNNKFYEFSIMTNVAPTLSYIRIKRTL